MRVPRPLSSFVGRVGTLADLGVLLRERQLITLTGPGGSGKTRLAIELAERVSDEFGDGAVFVPLAPIRDPALIVPTIAERLGLQDSRGRPLVQRLADYLAERDMLLILDNFEHLLDGAGVVSELVGAGSGTHVVVTSRAPLHLTGEQVFPVPPLPVDSDAVALFVARARSLMPDFSADASTVGAIAQRLDGLPLAIELAAARTRVLPPEALLARLDQSLDLLVGGGPDLPDRQQTLRSTIAWSHDLLSAAAREAFAVCAAFRGGAALVDLEAVATGRVADVVGAVQELVDHSLLRPLPDQARYAMLETVREFAVEQLTLHRESRQIAQAHATVFAQKVEPLDRPPIWQSNEYLAGLDAEHDNVRAALDWLQANDPPAALHMVAKLSAFWAIRGHFSEGRRRLRDVLDLVPEGTPDRVAALNGSAWLAQDQGELPEDILVESLEMASSIGDRVGEGTALLTRGRLELSAGDMDAAAQLVGKAKSIFEAAGDRKGVAVASLLLGAGASISAPPEVACAILEPCAELCRDLDLTNVRARTLQLLGIAHLRADNLAAARAALAEGVPAVVESGDRFGISLGLGALVMLALATSRPRLALRLTGVRDEFERFHEVTGPPPLRLLTEQLLAPVRSKLGAAVSAAVRADGRGLTVDQAVAAVLADDVEARWQGLTRRETEVAELVAAGLTNREIAERLVLAVRTVETHVDRILTKLGFGSRGQLTAWAHEHGLMAQVKVT